MPEHTDILLHGQNHGPGQSNSSYLVRPSRQHHTASVEPMTPIHPATPSTITATATATATAVVASTPLNQPTPFKPMPQFNLHATREDPLTANIVHDTDDRTLVRAMTLVADAGADAGAAADASSIRSSSSTHSTPSPVSSSSTFSPSLSSSSSATVTYAAGTVVSSRPTSRPNSINRPTVSRPTIEIPQPLSPISLHHALDGSLPPSVVNAKPTGATRILPRSIESCVQDTLAKESNQHYGPTPYQGSGSNGHRRIMTPTSRLAETAVGVREVSKKIGKYRCLSDNLSRARVKWETPKTVMIVTKPGDESLLKITREIAFWMIASRGLTVFVDEKLKDLAKFKYPSFLRSTKLGYDYTHSLKFWTSDLCAQEAHLFDFAVTLGGDGTVLFTSWLFQRIVPPILPFSAGSLGFLTPFPTVDYKTTLSTCLDHGVRVNLRMRFSCTIYRCLEHRSADKSKKKKRKGARRRTKNGVSQNTLVEESDDDSDEGKRSLPTVLTTPTETFEILNDLVLDRGPSANLSLLELFGDEEHLTTVQADGIVISTPTGSTAYSLAAGGPLTHPEIPAILISPICPHTLSFRPMLLPDSMELRICVPFDSRSTAWASFDGRGRVELKQGDHIKVTASVYPFPTICSSTQSSDWFHSLSRCLRWNERERQKGFRVVEHSRPRRTRQPSSTLISPLSSGKAPPGETAPSQPPSSIGGPNSTPQDASHPHPHHESSSVPSGSSNNSHHHHHHQQYHPGQDSHHASGNSSAGSTRTRQPSLRHGSGVQTPVMRKGSNGNPSDYYDHSPQDTDTMLTCWGTDDSSESDEDEDDDDSSPTEEKEGAEDGDGEWEEGSSSDDDDDDDVEVARVAARAQSEGDCRGEGSLCHDGSDGSGSSGRSILSKRVEALPDGSISALGAVKVLAEKLKKASLSDSECPRGGSMPGHPHQS
ncbi:hypothetical protein BGX28_003630 [Mortierella sp. GBA30]|nr:hypothetical protein BGX28_003630 [Mortierella sp. GBA30]